MRLSRFVLASSRSELERLVASEGSVRVARSDELEKVVSMMKEFETVHVGDDSSVRSWKNRIVGRHRCTVLLEHRDVPLAYILVSVSPVTSRSMSDIFGDTWSKTSNAPWAHINFYSVNSLNKAETHPFFGAAVGFPIIKKTAELIQTRGARQLLLERGLKENEDASDVTTGKSRLFTMSPVPGLRLWLEKNDPALLKRAISNLAEAKDALLERTEQIIGERKDPVAKFHLGNGAKLHQLNWAADESQLRMAQSFGIMCNYDYN
jgi:hypothetical protein